MTRAQFCTHMKIRSSALHKIICLGYLRLFIALLLPLICFEPSAPAAQPAQFISRGPGGGGALFAPSFSPFSQGEMYITCDMSEVFHSMNYGTSWDVVNFGQIQGGRQAIVQFTSNPNV